MLKYYISVILTVFSLHSFANNNAPNTKIQGHVTSDGEIVPFATIVIKDSNTGTATNEQGHFEIKAIPEGTYTVRVQAIGYIAKEVEIKVVQGKPVDLDFELDIDQIGLEEVVVSADRNNISRKEAPVIISPITEKLFSSTASTVLADGLSFSPGVRLEANCQNCGFTQVRMNGLEGPYTQILINSRPVFSSLAGVYGLEQIPATLIERVEVVRGGGSALFGGNAIAGTINIITKDPVDNSLTINNQYNLIGSAAGNTKAAGEFVTDFNASVVSKNQQTGLFVFGLYKDRKPWDANNDGFSELMIIENKSFGLRGFYKLGTDTKLSAEYHIVDEFRRGGNKFDLKAHEADITEMVDHMIHSGNITVDHFLTNDRLNKITAYVSGQSIDRQSYYGAEQDPNAYGHTTDLVIASGVQFSGQTDNLLFGTSRFITGLEYNYSNLFDEKLAIADNEEFQLTPVSTIADQYMTTTGLFIQNQWHISKFRVLIGLRGDYYDIQNDENTQGDISNFVVVPRANVMYDFTSELQLRVSFAQGYRAPQIFDEDLHILSSEARRIVHENSNDLKQERSTSYTASLDFSPKINQGQLSILFEGFFTQLQDPFAQDYSEPDATGTIVATRVNSTNAKVQGANFEFKYAPHTKLQAQMGGTWQLSRFNDQVEWAEGLYTKTMTRSPNTYGYMMINYSPSHHFDIAINSTYTGSMLVPHFGLEATHPDVLAGNIIAGNELEKSNPFFDLGIKLCYHLHFGHKYEAELCTGIKNMFNSFQKEFDKGVNRDAGYVYGPILPRTVYFGIKIEI